MIRLARVTILLAGVSLGCGAVAPSGTASKEPSPQAFLSKARALAEGELARLSAAEMMYRNRVFLHSYSYPSAGLQSFAYTKRYREFKDFEIVDIVKSESLLRPYRISIRYNFDIVGTDGVHVTRLNPKAAQLAAQDHRFRRFRSDSIVLDYDCDQDGEPLSAALPNLARPNYFEVGKKDVMGEFRVEPVPESFIRAGGVRGSG